MIKFKDYIAFPNDTTYQEWLRYIVQCCEPSDPEIHFLVNAWHTSLNEGVSDELEVLIRPYLDLACKYMNKVYDDNEKEFEAYKAELEARNHSNVIYLDGSRDNDARD